MPDFQRELEAAIADRDGLRAELGEAILAGKSTTALKTKLSKAEAAVEEAEIAQAAIVAASKRAAEREAEQAKATQEAEIAAKWQRAETDYNDLVATVAAKDRLLEKLAELNRREASQARAFADTYRDLGIKGSELHYRSWNGQLLQRLKTDCGLGPYLQKLLVYGIPGKPVAACVPGFDKLFPKAPKKAIEHQEAA
jgi:hypothetical protein